MRALLVLLSMLLALGAQAYDFIHYSGLYRYGPLRWAERPVRMNLRLSPADDSFYNDVAVDALDRWNSVLPGIFTTESQSRIGDDNGHNDVFFSRSVYGHAFGQDVLAITTIWHVRGKRVEGDTVFNSRDFAWDDYRGNLGNVIDLRRVAIHEFGHTLGLDHPDQNHQVVVSIMNSVISDLDDLAPDDARGARALYYPTDAHFTVTANVEPPDAGLVYVRPVPRTAESNYLANSPVTVLARAKRGWVFSHWRDNYDGDNFEPLAGALQRFRIYENRNLTAVFYTNMAPRILVPPRSRIADKGEDVAFTVRASGRELQYQWLHDDSEIPGATNATLILRGVLHEDSGLYSARISNMRAATVCKPARLVVDGY